MPTDIASSIKACNSSHASCEPRCQSAALEEAVKETPISQSSTARIARQQPPFRPWHRLLHLVHKSGALYASLLILCAIFPSSFKLLPKSYPRLLGLEGSRASRDGPLSLRLQTRSSHYSVHSGLHPSRFTDALATAIAFDTPFSNTSVAIQRAGSSHRPSNVTLTHLKSINRQGPWKLREFHHICKSNFSRRPHVPQTSRTERDRPWPRNYATLSHNQTLHVRR